MKRSKHKEIHKERQRAPDEPSGLVMDVWCGEDPVEDEEIEQETAGSRGLSWYQLPFQPNCSNFSRDPVLILHVHSIK